MKMRRFAIALLLILAQVTAPLIATTQAAGPSTGTAVAWTNDTYFDQYTSQSGVTTSDLSADNSLVWQAYYANAPLSLPADSVNRVGINTYQVGNNTVNWRIAISTVDDTLGSFGTESIFASASYSYSAGGFNEAPITTAVTIPAHRYFLIGVHEGPYYRSFKTLAANRSAQVGGVTYVTALNTLYYAPHTPSVVSGIPTALGGTSSAFTTYVGYAPVLSIKFKATGAPPAPSLATPETPTVSSILGTSVTISNPSLVANAQSYIASMYASNGTTLIETRTVTNAQVTAGFSWTGLTAQTTYQVGFTAVGDGTSYSNSVMSPLKSFTTNKNPTSVSFTYSPTLAIFNVPVTITATITGYTTGKITFTTNGKRIPGCISKNVTTSSVTCTWDPARRGVNLVSATYTPSSASYSSSTSSSSITIANRNTLR